MGYGLRFTIHARESKQSGILGATMFCSKSLGTNQNGKSTSAPKGSCGEVEMGFEVQGLGFRV
jgi:hypothetical protein